MAKGQKRSSREIRKPKQEKAPIQAAPTLGSQVKQATGAMAPRTGNKH